MDSTSGYGRGLPPIWDFLSEDGERQALEDAWGQYVDPSPDNPVDAGEFIARLDLRDLPRRIWNRYRKPQQVQWDPEALLRVVLYFGLKGYQHLTQAWRDLVHRPGLAKALGLGEVPPYKTLWHFVHKRLGLEGVRELFSRLVELVVSEGRARGLPIGEVVAVDAMPIEISGGDDEAEWSPYYEVRGFKAHNAVDAVYGIPLDVKVTRLNHNESPELPAALRRARTRGCPVAEVVADTQYNGLENFGVVCQEMKARFRTRFAITAAIDPDGERDRLWDMYERHWKEEGYLQSANLEERLEFLYRRGWMADVGAYHRNEAFRELLSDPLKYQEEYHRRVRVEADHGYWKQHIGMTKVEGRPMSYVELRYLLRLAGVLAVVLTRMQAGERTRLCRTVGIQ
jgi:Transposase DDE domain